MVPLCSRSSCSRGRPARLQHRHRVLVADLGQQRREVADVLLEQVEDRGDPALAEPDPRPHPLVLQLIGRVSVACRNSSIRVSPTARGRRGTASWRRGRPAARPASARRSSSAAKSCGATCRCSCTLVQADSGASVGRTDSRRSPAVDVEVHVLASGGEDRFVERRIARRRAHPSAGRGARASASAGCRSSTMSTPRRAALSSAALSEPAGRPRAEHRVARHRARRHVELDVVCAELRLEGRVRDLLQDGRLASVRLAFVSTRLSSTSRPVRGSSASLSKVAARASARTRRGRAAPSRGSAASPRGCSGCAVTSSPMG